VFARYRDWRRYSTQIQTGSLCAGLVAAYFAVIRFGARR
jgi:hypothetical protein